MSTVLDLITRNAAETLGLKGCSLGLFDRETRELQVVSAYGLGKSDLNEKRRLTDIPLSEALKGKPVMLKSTRESIESIFETRFLFVRITPFGSLVVPEV
jgi:hypothetical protein